MLCHSRISYSCDHSSSSIQEMDQSSGSQSWSPMWQLLRLMWSMTRIVTYCSDKESRDGHFMLLIQSNNGFFSWMVLTLIEDIHCLLCFQTNFIALTSWVRMLETLQGLTLRAGNSLSLWNISIWCDSGLETAPVLVANHRCSVYKVSVKLFSNWSRQTSNPFLLLPL